MDELLYNKCLDYSKSTVYLNRANVDYVEIVHDAFIEFDLTEDNYKGYIKRILLRSKDKIRNAEFNGNSIDGAFTRKKILQDFVCKKCKDTFPAAFEISNFNSRVGYKENQNICRTCWNKRKREYNSLPYVKEQIRLSGIKRRSNEQVNNIHKAKKRKHYHEVVKQDEIKMNKYRERNTAYKKNNTKVRSAQRLRYYHKNKETLNNQRKELGDKTAKERIKRYWEKQTREIGDAYVIRLLTRHKKISKKDITPEMIEERRNQVKEYRFNKSKKL